MVSKFNKMDAFWVALVYLVVAFLLVSIFALSFKKWELFHWCNLLIIIPFTISMFITFYLHRPYSGLRAGLLAIATCAIAVGVPLYIRNNGLGAITTTDILGITAFGATFIAVFASWVLNIVFVVKKKNNNNVKN